MNKPVLLYYCQHTDAMGGLVRAFTIGQGLTHRFRVVILNGGPLPPGVAIPADMELVQLPPRSDDGDAGLQSNTALRREMILATYARCSPRVILIETFPFGHAGLTDELTPLIERAREGFAAPPLLICCLTDLLSGTWQDKERHDDRITALLDKHFDAVIMHTDPAFARLGEFLQPRNALTIPVYHSGFVLRERDELPLTGRRRDERVLVAAGSGIDGSPLCRAAIEAHRLLWDVNRLPMTLIAGLSLADEDWQDLHDSASGLPGLHLQRSVADLGAEFAKVRWAVCDCSYNTSVDVLATRVSALLVPAGNSHDSAQADRAARLIYWHAARMLMPHHLNGASLASSIHQLMKFEPAASSFNLDGAEITANLIYHLSLFEDVRPDNLTSGAFTDHPRMH
jgi:predicted glycosyltransferase